MGPQPTCPFAQLRREQLPVAQDPDPEARQQPVDQPESQGGHGEGTDPEQRRLSPAQRLLDVLPLHDGECVLQCACARGDLTFRLSALISSHNEREPLYKGLVASHSHPQHLSGLI